MSPSTPQAPVTPHDEVAGFEVSLVNFSGPFDLLLSLIAKHRLDITEVALAQVTDEFIAYITAQEEWDLGQASQFLVVAATLLDLKAARLLPRGEVSDVEDLELLEARDLLFARLLQYRAFKEVAADLGRRWSQHSGAHPRAVQLEPRFAALLPELVLRIGPEDLAVLAAAALSDRAAPPQVGVDHMHHPRVSVRDQAALLGDRLRRRGAASFRTLTEDADHLGVVVARFLALLELFREGAVAFDQAEALGELRVRWTGVVDGHIDVSAEYDESADTPGGTVPERAGSRGDADPEPIPAAGEEEGNDG